MEGDGFVNSLFIQQISAVLSGPELDTEITAIKTAWFLPSRSHIIRG